MIALGVYIFFAACVLCPPFGIMVALYVIANVWAEVTMPASRRRRRRGW